MAHAVRVGGAWHVCAYERSKQEKGKSNNNTTATTAARHRQHCKLQRALQHAANILLRATFLAPRNVKKKGLFQLKNVCLTVVGCATATATATVAVVLSGECSNDSSSSCGQSSLRDFMAVWPLQQEAPSATALASLVLFHLPRPLDFKHMNYLNSHLFYEARKEL